MPAVWIDLFEDGVLVVVYLDVVGEGLLHFAQQVGVDQGDLGSCRWIFGLEFEANRDLGELFGFGLAVSALLGSGIGHVVWFGGWERGSADIVVAKERNRRHRRIGSEGWLVGRLRRE